MKDQEVWDEFAHIFFSALQHQWKPQEGGIPWSISVWNAAITEQQSAGNLFIEGWGIREEDDCFFLKRLWYSGIRHGLFQWQNGRQYAIVIPRVPVERQEALLLNEKSTSISALVQSYLSKLAEVP